MSARRCEVSRAWAVLLAAALLAPEPALAARAATAKATRKPAAKSSAKKAPAPSARPDRALFQEALDAHAALKASVKRQQRKTEWERVVLRYRLVVARYPQSAYCDDALLAVGDLYHRMAERFKTPSYDDDAVAAYRSVVSEYPSSSKGEDALFAVVEIARLSGDRKRLADAATAYLDAFPEARRRDMVKAILRKSAPAQAASLRAPPPRGLAQVFNLRFWTGDSSTRVVIDVERQVKIHYDRIQDPDRLWVDLEGARLHPNLTGRSFPVGDGLLEKVRVGQNRDDVVRVVLDFKDVKDHAVFYLENPMRLVIDVRGAGRPPAIVAQADPARPHSPTGVTPAATGGALPPAPPQAPLPIRHVGGLSVPPVAVPPASTTPVRGTPAPFDGTMSRRAATVPAPTPPPPAPEVRTAKGGTEPMVPQPAQVTRAGSYSLARQLGLGARRIVIDAGHGGHDPGTIGRAGLQEKDLVLDVAARLDRLVRTELGAEVIMTRATDVFIPLEERTAIANSKGADLFLSIHANSSRNPQARGVETYFLNFAADPHAEAVAARENAISAATLKDLQNLVKAITLNSKIDESREFATSVQEAMIGGLRPQFPQIQDRGVRTAPFYVLIGANMPSVLAEIAFVSSPEEERLLKTQEHRERIARSLLDGVRAYLDGLDRSRGRQLTGSGRGSTVVSRNRR